MTLRYCLAAAVLCACGGSNAPSPADGGTTQADLAGSYWLVQTLHGSSVMNGTLPGWVRGKVTIDAAGAVTPVDVADSGGGTGGPPATWLVDADGIVTSPVEAAFWGRLGARRELVVGTTTIGDACVLRVLLKQQPQATYALADLTAQPFAYHFLSFGSVTGWEHGRATFDAAGQLKLTNRYGSTGPQADLVVGTASIDADGVVTLSGDPTFRAYLSADKTLLVTTKTSSAGTHAYGVNVLTRLAPSYAQQDLAGSYTIHRWLASSAGGGWAHGAVTIDAAGNVVTTRMLTNGGSTVVPGPGLLTIAADGTVLNPNRPTFHGSLNVWKDAIIRTETIDPYAQLSFGLK